LDLVADNFATYLTKDKEKRLEKVVHSASNSNNRMRNSLLLLFFSLFVIEISSRFELENYVLRKKIASEY